MAQSGHSFPHININDISPAKALPFPCQQPNSSDNKIMLVACALPYPWFIEPKGIMIFTITVVSS